MNKFVESLRRLYQAGKIKKDQIDKLNLSDAEKAYVLDKEN